MIIRRLAFVFYEHKLLRDSFQPIVSFYTCTTRQLPLPSTNPTPCGILFIFAFCQCVYLTVCIFSSFIVFFVCDMFCCQLSVVFFWTIIFQKISAYYLLFSVVFLRAKLFCYRSICHVNAPTRKAAGYLLF